MSVNIPNFDTLTQEELLAWNKLGDTDPAFAEKIGVNQVCLLLLQCYATTRASSIEAYMKGDMIRHTSLEQMCKNLYTNFPEYLQW